MIQDRHADPNSEYDSQLPITPTVPLAFEARAIAERCSRGRGNGQQAKRTYLNVLAVWASEFYLRCLGFSIDRDRTLSYSRFAGYFLDTADLWVESVGRLECRPLMPEARVASLPLDVRSDRLAYLIVELAPSLHSATLRGFSPTPAATLAIDELRPIETLPGYLAQWRVSAPISLSAWLSGGAIAGWEALENLLGNRAQLVPLRSQPAVAAGIGRAKLLDIGLQLSDRSVVLAIAVVRQSDDTASVRVQLFPSPDEASVPESLELSMLDESGETLQVVRSRQQDNYIQLRSFQGRCGDRFSLEVAWGEARVRESFVF